MKTFLEVSGVILGFAIVYGMALAGGGCKDPRCEVSGHTWAC